MGQRMTRSNKKGELISEENLENSGNQSKRKTKSRLKNYKYS
jgi:hypothetical protein